MRGLKPWDQFLIYCDMFANTEGSWLWADQISDPRHLSEYEQQYEEAQRNPDRFRPPLAGYDALLSAINGLRNDIRIVKGLPTLDGPKTPLDELAERKKRVSNSNLDKALGF